MVKSKFPGKPSKLVQRSLVSAFSVTVPSCDTSTIAENVCCGLSVFENAFGNEDNDELDFAGFTHEEVESSLTKREEFLRDVTEKYSARGLTYTCSINEKLITPAHRIAAKEKKEKSEITLIISVEPKISRFPNKKKKERRKCGKIWFVTKKNMVNQYHPKIALRHSFKKNSLLRFKHKSLSSNYLSDKFRRKFIVPSRSLHSSRVIKPTKRLIENEKYNRGAVKRLRRGKEESKCEEHDAVIPEDMHRLDVPANKVIIREARLNITSETAITGPFSMKKSIPGTSNKSIINKEIARKNNSSEKEHVVLRGPRIKHVCRSASSVLRTSSEGSNECDIEDSMNGSFSADFVKSGNRNPNSDKGSQLNRIRQCSDGNIALVDGQIDNESSQCQGARCLQDFSIQSSDESEEYEREDKLISTDFWEAYDPDEVCKTGFTVICSELLNVRALCFLCGSAGIEKLLYCVACCEPYHWYCAEGPSAFREEAELEKHRVNWICRKCKICSTCGKGGDLRTLSSCKRCRNSYHSECLNDKTTNKRLLKSDRPWVCPSCLKCKSCNSNTVFTHVGNIPLCSQCFKLRQKGNYCPLCQGCYQDEDYNVQMMECGICKCWIHAKCEGISNEKYQILSFLPDSIEFVCRLCCTVPPAQWWLAVEDELKAGFYGVLKSLCNNKKIGDLLKESPRKDCNSCSCNNSDSSALPSTVTDIEQELKSPLAHCKRALDFDVKSESDVAEKKSPTTKLSDNEATRKCSSCYSDVKIRNGISERLLATKANVRTNQYASVFAFNQQLESVLIELEESDSIGKYHEILKQFFPWFDPENTQYEEVQNESVETITKENASTSSKSKDSSDLDDEYAELRKRISADEYKYENFKMLDVRRCKFCQGLGEAIAPEGGRLIYCGRNEWVHSNCALWSSEVFEEIDGSLQNVHSAISRGRQIACSNCGKKGASVGCCFKNCTLTYHFLCAQKSKCIFLQNKTIYCSNHDLKENNLQLLINEKDFEILRPVYIEMDRKKKKLECHTNIKLRIGSLHVESLGRIDPHLSDNPRYILPMYFRCTRLFWSTKKPWKIVQYHIKITMSYHYEDNKSDADINYTIDHSVDDTQKIIQKSSSSISSNGGKENEPLPSLLIEESPLYDTADNPSYQCGFALKNRNKRKIFASEKSPLGPNSKKNIPESTYLTAAKINHVVFELPQLDGMIDIYADEEPEPVKCIQCHRTYRTTFSYERHLDTCSADFGDFMISSCESDSVSSEEDKLAGYGPGAKLASLDNSQIIDMDPINSTLASKYPDTYIIENNKKISGAVPTYLNNITPNADVNSILYPCTTMTYEDAHLVNNVLPSNVTLMPNVKQDTVGVVGPQPITLPVAAPEPTIKLIVDHNGKISACNTNYNTQLSSPQSYSIQNINSTPTYVIQQPYHKPAEMIPTFVTVDNTPPLQQLQLQTLAQSPVNFQPMVPTILGAIMQPNILETTPTTAYIMNASTTTDLYGPQNVILPSQPVIFGMETVVSNTVMSSSHQYMTQSLSGANIGQSTLYSTTTTQVFQAAKQLPPQPASQPDLSSSYIVLNSPLSSQGQSSIQTIHNMSTLQEMQQHAEPQVTVVSGNSGDKYMYVQINNDCNNSVPEAAPRKLMPVIVKPAVKQILPSKKNTKVMKVKNNRPIAIQTADSVIPLADNTLGARTCPSRDEASFSPNVKNLQIKTTNRAVLCGHGGNESKTVKTAILHSGGGETKIEQKRAPTVVASVSRSSSNVSKVVNAAGDDRIVTDHIRENASEILQVPASQAEVNLSTIVIASPPSLSVNLTDKVEIAEILQNTNELPEGPLIEGRGNAVLNGRKFPCSVVSTSLDVHKEKTPFILNESKIGSTNKKNTPLRKSNFAPNIPEDTTLTSGNSLNANKLISVQEKGDPVSMPLLDLSDEVREQDKECTFKRTTKPLLGEPVCRKYVPNIVYQDPGTTLPKSAPVVEPVIRSSASETDRIFDELVRQHKLSMEKKATAKYKLSTKESAVSSAKPKDESTKDSPASKRMAGAQSETSKKVKKSPDPKEKENLTTCEKNGQSKSWKTASISFEVNAEDGFSYKTNDLHDLWNKILESVQHSRNEYKLPLLPKNALVDSKSVYSLLGFENKASKYLLEQLPDAWKCIFYKPTFCKSTLYGKTSSIENLSGCARTEPFTSSHKFDMFGWLASRHRKPPKFMMVSDSDIVNGNRRITSLNLPMAMRFRHLKETAKETVGVFRSDIHGRGLFCLRDIDAGEMVIEYAGEVVRSTLTDKREKYYTSKGIGCYMFRIDDRYVVDATMCGNAARFINHSCDPNCYSRIVDILGKKHILIFALRRIPKGEELTYDYKFPLEEDKIHCHCLARKCRKYLN